MTKSQQFQRASRTASRSRWWRVSAVWAAALSWATCVQAQAPGPNTGSLTFTGGFDVASSLVFRGFVQEEDPKITVFPYGDIGIVLTAGDGLVKSSAVNFGVWNSLNTGSSGTNGPSGQAHYEEDFYSRMNLLFGGGIAISAGYMARTSPNNMFNTATEFQLKAVRVDRLNPYGFLASELSVDGQADNGVRKGTYLELGVAPGFALSGGKARLTIPTRVGASVRDYYELAGTDHAFGFVAVGGIVTVPLRAVAPRFGSWSLHGGADAFALGDATKTANNGHTTKLVGLVGVGVTY